MKIALGTVQFGVDYGVNNSNGQVKIDEVRNILLTNIRAAVPETTTINNINFIDYK